MANKFPTSQSFQRLNNFPLDETLMFDTLAQAQNYASNNPTAYKGQIVHVKDARTDTEINEGVFIYEETCYIDLFKNIKPICSFTYEAMRLFFDLMYEILDGPTEETRNKLDDLKEIMYDNYTYKYGSLDELPTGDYHTQPWHLDNYNDYQIVLKMTHSAYFIGSTVEDPIFGDANIVSKELIKYYGKEALGKYQGEYLVYTLDSIPSSISFSRGDYISEVVTLGGYKIYHGGNMFSRCYNLTKINDHIFEDITHLSSVYGMFFMCKNLKEVKLSHTTVQDDISLYQVFYDCSSLKEIDLTGWAKDGGLKPTNTNGLFHGCSELESLDISFISDTSKVTDMTEMFKYCINLTSLDVSNFKTNNVNSFKGMFQYCSKLESLDISGFDFSHANDISYMFSDCRSAKEIILPSYTGCENMSHLFENCASLTNIDIDKLYIADTTDISYLFAGCSSITSLNLSEWDVYHILDFSYLLYNCEELIELDLSNWKIGWVIVNQERADMTCMLRGCKLFFTDIVLNNTTSQTRYLIQNSF